MLSRGIIGKTHQSLINFVMKKHPMDIQGEGIFVG